MRTLLLLAALALPPWVSAQTGLDAPRPEAFDNPEVVFSLIGRAWDDLEAETPMPDSGAVVTGTGSVRWLTTDDEVEWIQADVVSGRIVQLSVRPGPEVMPGELADFARELKQDLGRPGPNGYYDATNWPGLRRAPIESPEANLKIQIAMFVANRLMVIRLTPGSRP